MNNYLVKTIFGHAINSDIIKEIRRQKIKDIKMATELKIKSKVPYPIKEIYYPVIPLNIYQTWHTKDLPPLMKNAVNSIIYTNPEFNHQLFDDNDCRNFIKDNFDENVLNAFDSLIPGAYKADLWRYCILYKNGGVYLDIKYTPFNGFKFISLMEKEHFTLDMDKNGIYNALIVCKPNNEILLKAINKVVDNVKNKFYGNSPLEPTGPLMLSQFFTQNDKKNIDMYHDIYISIVNRFIFFNGYLVLKSYNSYLDEHNKNKKVSYYGSLWITRNIYK
jgi:mannosyltransferase OCH1-like enzyme